MLREDGYAGLAVYVRNDLSCTCLRTDSVNGVQIAVLKFHSLDFKLVSVYRQPRNDNMPTFTAILYEILDSSDNLLLVGDTNINLLKSEPITDAYLNLLESNFTYLLNRISSQDFTFPIEPIRPVAPGSLVDHFATNFFHKSFTLSLHHVDFTDHRLSILSIDNIQVETTMTNISRVYWTSVRRSFLELLDRTHNISLSLLHESLTQIVIENQTRTQANLRDQGPTWLSTDLRTEMLHRDYLNQECKNPLLNDYEREMRKTIYKRQRNRVTAMIRQAKRLEIDTMVRNACGDDSRMWKVVNYVLTNRRKTFRKSLPIQLLDSSNDLIDRPLEMADRFVDFFADIADDLKLKLMTKN